MALSGQALKTSKSGDCTISEQPVPLLHSSQGEQFFLITNLNFPIGQRKKMRRKREKRINTKWQDNTERKLNLHILILHAYNTSSWKGKDTEGVCSEWQMGKLQVKYKISNSPWWQRIRRYSFYCQNKKHIPLRKPNKKPCWMLQCMPSNYCFPQCVPVTHCATINWHMVLIQGI